MNGNSLWIRRLLELLAMALSVVGIVAGTLQWPMAICYAILLLTLAAALLATKAERAGRRAR